MKLSTLSDRLAAELVGMGLHPGDREWEDEDGTQTRLLATWTVDSDSDVEVRIYVAEYFGSHPFWVGFGSERAEDVRAVLRNVAASSYVILNWSDWTEEFGLSNHVKSKPLRNADFTAYEDYRSHHHWVWYGRYFDRLEETRPLDFLRTVVQLGRTDAALGFSGPTEKIVPKKVRLQQDKFRRTLISLRGERCALTDCRIGALLEAAHIDPWAKNEKARLSSDNGLLLLATVHRLFDRGIISFDNDGRIKLKSLIDRKELKRLNIHQGMRLRHNLTQGLKLNLLSHRNRWGF